MKRIISLSLVLLCAFVYTGCAQPKVTPDARATALKAKMYDIDRQIRDVEQVINKKTTLTKAQKEMNANVRKSLEAAKKDLAELQVRIDETASASVEAWDGFVVSLEQGADKLNDRLGKIAAAFTE